MKIISLTRFCFSYLFPILQSLSPPSVVTIYTCPLYPVCLPISGWNDVWPSPVDVSARGGRVRLLVGIFRNSVFLTVGKNRVHLASRIEFRGTPGQSPFKNL
jgi:hypothetical protein